MSAVRGAPVERPSRARAWAAIRARFEKRPELFTLFLIIALGAVVGGINPDFFQPATLFDLVRSSTVTGLFALGVYVVLVAGGIDVSFTAIAAFAMYTTTKLTLLEWPDAPLVLVFVACGLGGALLGLVNGLLVHGLKAPSLIVTIGTQYVIRGLLLTYIGTVWLEDLPRSMDSFGKLALVEFQSGRGLHVMLPAFV
ncbi:MAG TPA: ABC transporter permease, partial [Burkholderiaceae bacterium]|nr:ABC transporter permease [Burkholderiaceae bacterium]